MGPLDELCLGASVGIAQAVMDDDLWRGFGYRRRPRRGLFWRRFVASEKLEREDTLAREVWAAAFSHTVLWSLAHDDFRYRDVFVARLMGYCIDGLEEPLWPLFHFEDRCSAADFVRGAACGYLYNDETSRMREFIERCKLAMQQPVPKVWHIGASILHTKFELGMRTVTYNASEFSDCDISRKDLDPYFLILAEDMLPDSDRR